MEGPPSVSAGGGTGDGADVYLNQNSFSSAYLSLEQTIRNFSKEKVTYEQNIEGMKNQISIMKDHQQNLKSQYETRIAENQKLVELLKEQQGLRLNLEAVFANVERKQDIIVETLEGFEKVERDIFSRYEGYDEFVHCLKYRQLQLLKWIDDAGRNKMLMEENLRSQEEELNSMRMAMDETAAQARIQLSQHENENLNLQNELETIKKNSELTIMKLTEENEGAKNMLTAMTKNMEIQMISMGEEKENLMKQIEDMTADNRAKVSAMMEEKAKILNELEMISKELQDVKGSLDQCIQEKQVMQQELEAAKKNLDETIANFSTEKEDLLGKLAEAKETLETQGTNFAKEKESLNVAMEELTKENELKLSSMLEEKLKLSTELEVFQKELEDAKCSIAQNLQEKDALQQQLETAKNESIEALVKLSMEKEDVEIKLADTTKILENLKISTTEEKEALNKQIEEIKSENESKLTQMADEKSHLSDKLEISKEEIADFKKSMEQQRVDFEKEKASLEKKIRQVNESWEKKFANVQSALKSATARPSLTGILKRPNQESEKTKSVSFGRTEVSDFFVSSSSDTDSPPGSDLYSLKSKGSKENKRDPLKDGSSSGKRSKYFGDWGSDDTVLAKKPKPLEIRHSEGSHSQDSGAKQPRRIRRITSIKGPLTSTP